MRISDWSSDVFSSDLWLLAQTAATAFDAGDPTGSLLGVPGITGFAAPITMLTAAAGTATTGPIPVGLYLVTAGALPPGVQPAAPVVISVPLTAADSGDWRYALISEAHTSDLQSLK